MVEKQVDLSGLMVGEVELPKLDVTPYIGRKTKIEKVTSYEGEYDGKTTYYYRVETEILDVLKKADGTGLELRASKILGLTMVEGGKVGWGKNSNTAAYLKKMKVNQPEELVGKNVVVQTTYNKKKEQDFLSF